MKPDDLPVEALKAGIAAWTANLGRSYPAAIRMVIVEAIKAWPNRETIFRSEDGKVYSIILPVPQEKAMAKDWTEQKAIELLEQENGQLRSFNKELLYDNEQKYAELQRLQDRLKYGSAVELSSGNSNLTSYMFHWEGRALDAEKEVNKLRNALSLIIDHPVAESGQWFVGVKEIKNVARAALEGK